MTSVLVREWERRQLPGLDLASLGAEAASAALPRHQLRVRATRGGLEVEARAHVGRVQLGELTVTIAPKLAADPLLALLRYTYDLPALGLRDDAAGYAEGSLLQDLLAEQLRREITRLLDHGLDRRYRPVAADLPLIRGRLDIGALARRMPLLRAELPCREHRRSADHPLHQALLGGLRLAARLVTHAPLRADLHRLAARLAAEVDERPLTRALLSAARRGIDRLSQRYRPALRLTGLLHRAAGLDLARSPGDTAAPGFLFDMNRFFQALLLRFLREHLPDAAVHSERRAPGVFAWSQTHLARKTPSLRPDFTVRHGARTDILDAKYRDLSAGALPRIMLYQLALYAFSQGPSGRAAILYPVHHGAGARAERVDLREPVDHELRARVDLRPVPLDRLAALVTAGEPARREREALARTLAFG